MRCSRSAIPVAGTTSTTSQRRSTPTPTTGCRSRLLPARNYSAGRSFRRIARRPARMSEAPVPIFDLSERQSGADEFDDLERCRDFDRTMRTQLIIPMQHLMKLLEPFVSDGRSVLEVGCGPALL